MSLWHTYSQKKLEEEFGIRLDRGLDDSRVDQLRREYGPNRLPPEKRPPGIILFFRQFWSPLILVLFGSAAILFFLGSWTDAGIILFVLVFNASVGTFQEGKAQHTLDALKEFITTQTTVLRTGKELIVPDAELVPGDVILIAEGEKIPADSRLISVVGLRVDESALTGESVPIDKTDKPIKKTSLPLTDRYNMVYKGTTVVSGSGRAIVVATGTSTEIGRISKELTTLHGDIPLAKEISSLSKSILLVTVLICALLFAVGILAGHSVISMFGTVVSLSVSIIPEGLPIVLTLVLANGVWRMAKRNAIVKRMQAVEALGQADVIAVDKTGTITKNEMVVRTLHANGSSYEVTGSGYEPAGSIVYGDSGLDENTRAQLVPLIRLGALAANAHVAQEGTTGPWRVTGDPTEAAMVVLAQKFGVTKEAVLQEAPRMAELPFHYSNKYHATLHTVGDTHLVCVAGAPEVLLERSIHLLKDGFPAELKDADKDRIRGVVADFSQKGLRVIAFASREKGIKNLSVLDNADVSDLTFVGVMGIEDSIRPEARDAVARARRAGLKVLMMTGDSPVTARAIAEQAGIARPNDRILTGEEIDSMDTEELSRLIPQTSVFARMTPDHKLKIIDAVKQRGGIIAMTGDGVNDAPALVAADLGIAMGKIGTEVAKEASDIVLLDDNFSSIVAAIEEGRIIAIRIKRVILYLFANNVAEVLLVATTLLLGLPLPLLPAQIIWLNLITDSFLDVSIGMEPNHGNALDRAKKKRTALFDGLMAYRMLLMSFPTTLGALLVFALTVDTDYPKAMTLALTTIAISQWFNAWNCRSEHTTIFRWRFFFSNRYLLAAVCFVASLHVLAVSTPFFQGILHTTALSFSEWVLCIGISALTLVPEELRKIFSRPRDLSGTIDAGTLQQIPVNNQ